MIRSRRDSLTLAISDLAARERAAISKMGYLDAQTGNQRSRSDTTLDAVRDWLEHSVFYGAVWTDGERNF
ncbi:MAG: hypothetical protein Ct9H300mP16_08770 [Pseudomonadota bacterium]|nr:MAG: hypothetical protein Ct9H300mP16_08770 [Pseudomonadota bacterium]